MANRVCYLAKDGHSVTMELTFWMAKDGSIHLVTPPRIEKLAGARMHGAFKHRTGGRVTGHMYRKLEAILKHMGAVPTAS